MNWLNEVQYSIDYMEEHLEEDITEAQLAVFLQVPFTYYQRIFTILCGITPKQYLRCRRLSAAALELKYSKDTILNIACRYGYGNEESFRKAFVRFHGCTPSQARDRNGKIRTFTPITLQVQLKGASSLTYQIIELPEISLQTHSHKFSSNQSAFRHEIPLFWQKFFSSDLYGIFGAAYLNAKHLKRILGIDTIATEQDKEIISYAAAIECDSPLSDCISVTLPSHTWLVFSAHGTMPECIQRLWTQIYTEFFPHPVYEPLQEIHMEGYDPEDITLCEIYIPVRRK